MKIVFKQFLFLLMCAALYCSCGDINYMHQEYLDRGESIYLGLVDSVTVSPGNERAKFKWMLNSDPRISKVVIYWNNYLDSTVVEVDRTLPGVMWMEKELPFPESDYVFYFVAKDEEGHFSMPTEKSVTIYGANYAATLFNRELTDHKINSSGQGELTWALIGTNTLQYTIVTYTDYSDPDNPQEKEVRVENTDMKTTLDGARVGESFRVVSYFLPEEGALDVFAAKEKVYTF